MSEDKPKKKRKKNAASEENGGEKGHKKPWTETYATVEEIKAFLGAHVYLRHNVITGRSVGACLSRSGLYDRRYAHPRLYPLALYRLHPSH